MPETSNSPIATRAKVTPKRRRLSLVWIIPILAAAAGGWVAVTRILSEGPTITIVLHSAEGIEAGKTKIRYNGVEIGSLTTIELSDDHKSVVATAQMVPKAEGFLVDDTQFWVVRPRVSGATITGLGTLVTGAYVGMEIGHSEKKRHHFTALKMAPVVTTDVPGRFFDLKTTNLGSLDDGTPLYFRRLKVGKVSSYSLDEDGQQLTVKVFVEAPYDKLVTKNTRFWHASGIDLSLSAAGLKVETESVLSILVGGIAFETPENSVNMEEAPQNTLFKLFANRQDAFELPSQDPQKYVVVFDQSVRGLTAGAPVEFRGIPIGEVVDVGAQLDINTMQFTVPVTMLLDAERLGVRVKNLPPGTDLQELRHKIIDTMVENGVRAQLRSGSLVTGSLYVAIDFFPDAAPASVDWSAEPPRFPTIPGQLQALEARVTQIIDKIDKLPLAEIAAELKTSIEDLDRVLISARTTLDDAGKLIAPESPLAVQLDNTLQEMTRAARGLRVLADYLERHPEALLRGKSGEAK